MTDQVFAYIARCPHCQQVIGATVDLPEYQKDTGAEVGKWIAAGLTVEHVTVEEARAQFGSCQCEEKKQ